MNNFSIWEKHPLKKRIIYLVNYSSVFNDVIHLNELKKILDPENQIDNELDLALLELSYEGKIIIRKGFAGIPNLGGKIATKSFDIFIAKSILDGLKNILLIIGKLNIIKFVGISGSIAANNPVENDNSKLDLDIFIITRRQRLWVFGFLEALYRNLGIQSIMKFPLCFNYILDESDLTVHNQNFYTATEIKNIIPIFGLDTYALFLKHNEWVYRFYPHLKYEYIDYSPVNPSKSHFPLNKILFVFYYISWCIKKFSFKPLLDLSFDFSPFRVINPNRKVPSNGGYQYLIGNKFEENLKKYFPEYYDHVLVKWMFTDQLTMVTNNMDTEAITKSIHDRKSVANVKILFAKYE